VIVPKRSSSSQVEDTEAKATDTDTFTDRVAAVRNYVSVIFKLINVVRAIAGNKNNNNLLKPSSQQNSAQNGAQNEADNNSSSSISGNNNNSNSSTHESNTEL